MIIVLWMAYIYLVYSLYKIKSYRLMYILIASAVLALVTGCSTVPSTPVEVKIPVPVLCTTPNPDEPVIACYKDDADIFDTVKCLLYERKVRIAYEQELKAALDSCK